MNHGTIRFGLLLASITVLGCGPMITDASTLPDHLSVCGWDWGYDDTIAPRALAEITKEIGREPPILDRSSMLCPRGACTKADMEAGNHARGVCEDRFWVRVGWDAYAQYGMLFRL